MFDVILAQIPALVVGLAIAVLVFSIAKAATRPRNYLEMDDDWRDPPPLIYRLFKPVVRIFCGDVRSMMSDDTYQNVQKKLSAGGMNYALLPEEFVTLKWICLILGVVLGVALYASRPVISNEMMLVINLLGPLGFFYPDLWLRSQTATRRREFEKEFPFLLDLLVLSMRAGLNYSSSLGQAVGNLPNGPVKDEFGKLLREIRAGKERRDALLDLGERIDIPSVHGFVASMNQADETGGEIVDVLYNQAEQKRAERFNIAEEQANKAPIKMLVPMMLFLFPIIFFLVVFIMIVKMKSSGILPPLLMNLL